MGPRDLVLGNPCHSYTRQLLESVPASHPGRRRTRDPIARVIQSPVFSPGTIRDTGQLEVVAPGHFVRVEESRAIIGSSGHRDKIKVVPFAGRDMA